MCDSSPREDAMVEAYPGAWCDPCIAPLVKALNGNGFPTVASCCGHGDQPANVALADGRQVFLAGPEWAEVVWGAIAAKRRASEVTEEEVEAAARAFVEDDLGIAWEDVKLEYREACKRNCRIGLQAARRVSQPSGEEG